MQRGEGCGKLEPCDGDIVGGRCDPSSPRVVEIESLMIEKGCLIAMYTTHAPRLQSRARIESREGRCHRLMINTYATWLMIGSTRGKNVQTWGPRPSRVKQGVRERGATDELSEGGRILYCRKQVQWRVNLFMCIRSVLYTSLPLSVPVAQLFARLICASHLRIGPNRRTSNVAA